MMTERKPQAFLGKTGLLPIFTAGPASGQFGKFYLKFTDPVTDEPATIVLDIDIMLFYYERIKIAGIDRAAAAATGGIALAVANITEDDEQRIRVALEALQQAIERWDTLEDLVLSVSYEQLLAKTVTWGEAARRASLMLQRDISTNAWRMAVTRYASRHDLPKIELHKSPKQHKDA